MWLQREKPLPLMHWVTFLSTTVATQDPALQPLLSIKRQLTRHYGFGTQCITPTTSSPTCNTVSSVTIGGKNAPITGWADSQITVTVPSDVPLCALQQQAQYGGSNANCGELVITAGNGKQSIDAVSVTIGGKAPTHVTSRYDHPKRH